MTGEVRDTSPTLGSLLVSQISMQCLLFFRRPGATFFTLGLPVVLLLLFAAVFGEGFERRTGVSVAQFYAPALAVFGAISAAFTYLAGSTASARDRGVLKRVRTAPVPPAIYFAARIASAGLIAVIAMLLLMAIGGIILGTQMDAVRLPAAILAALFGIVAFAACGMAVVAFVRSGDTAQAVTNALVLPLGFISGVFVHPSAGIPQWIATISELFPMRPFARAFTGAFDSRLQGSGFAWDSANNAYAVLPDLLVLALWTAVAAWVALRWFRWEADGE